MARVLMVNIEGRIAGAEKSLLQLVKYLHLSHSLSLACPQTGPLCESMGRLGITCYPLPAISAHNYLSPGWLMGWLRWNYRLLRIMMTVRPDLVHANSFYAVIFLVLPTLATRRKLIWHARDFIRFGLPIKLCSWFCQRIIAVSRSVRDSLIGQGVNRDKIEVVYNGVEIDMAKRDQRRKEPNDLNNNSMVFANIGQFVPWKKQILFLQAAARITGELPHVRFMMVGDDIFQRDLCYKQEILDTINNMGISKKVAIVGWQRDMAKIWDRVTCLVHTTDVEPFGRVIIEAMAQKIMVIAIDNCGPGEIIQNNKTGLLVPPNDIKGLSEAMLKVVREPERAKQMAMAGYEHVVHNFSAAKTARSIEKIYKDVLEG